MEGKSESSRRQHLLIMRMMKKGIRLIALLMVTALMGHAQERTAPLLWNGLLSGTANSAVNDQPVKKGTALTLPFFEDFTDNAPYPNSNRWQDSNVYINNTMCIGPVSRGVATFDALNKRGRPYDTVNRNALYFADSLTSQPFDLSTFNPADSIYLSFFYQPQGNGFSPEPNDSLILFFHHQSGAWQRVWSVGGTVLQPFRQVMIPVKDAGYLYNGFEFRFINRASINTNDDVWNLDYIRMQAARTITDTAVNDLAFTSNQTNLLNDYVSMPYRQFMVNPGNELANDFSDSIRNHYATQATVNYGYSSRELTTSTPLSANGSTIDIPARSARRVTFNRFTNTPAAPASNSRMVFETTSYLESGTRNEPKENDTLVHRQVFDNYLAYDDGTAEKSYYLSLLSSLPGKVAVEHRLNQPDTLQGLAIYFGQQVPTAVGKIMSIVAYRTIAGISGATRDSIITSVDNLLPLYTDSINKFTIYKFSRPAIISAGTFYVGYTLPANSGSDSLYIGLDVNRVGSNHVYFSVLNSWSSSTVSGALMIRPLLGGPVTGTGVKEAVSVKPFSNWSVYPNPASDQVQLLQAANSLADHYSITDLSGREMAQGTLTGTTINISSLPSGIYLVRLRAQGYWSTPKKIIKK
jgi:hypothetical protein